MGVSSKALWAAFLQRQRLAYRWQNDISELSCERRHFAVTAERRKQAYRIAARRSGEGDDNRSGGRKTRREGEKVAGAGEAAWRLQRHRPHTGVSSGEAVMAYKP